MNAYIKVTFNKVCYSIFQIKLSDLRYEDILYSTVYNNVNEFLDPYGLYSPNIDRIHYKVKVALTRYCDIYHINRNDMNYYRHLNSNRILPKTKLETVPVGFLNRHYEKYNWQYECDSFWAELIKKCHRDSYYKDELKLALKTDGIEIDDANWQDYSKFINLNKSLVYFNSHVDRRHDVDASDFIIGKLLKLVKPEIKYKVVDFDDTELGKAITKLDAIEIFKQRYPQFDEKYIEPFIIKL